MNDVRHNMLNRVGAEIDRAVALKEEHEKFPATTLDTVEHCVGVWSPSMLVNAGKLAILSEEHGEVARLVNEALIDVRRYSPAKMKEELIQLAATATAWAESIEKDG